MAKQKVRSTASWTIFVRSAYHMYGLALKNTPLLVSQTFCLAIS